ncbi:MAG: YidH family protein [Acidimicrobiales bacterium]
MLRPGRRPSAHEVGTEPDSRFSYANERTFRAWIRTALALVATGLAVTQLLPKIAFVGGRRLIGLPLITLGVVCSLMSYHRWEVNQIAMRLGQPLPPSRLPQVVALGVASIALVALGSLHLSVDRMGGMRRRLEASPQPSPTASRGARRCPWTVP